MSKSSIGEIRQLQAAMQNQVGKLTLIMTEVWNHQNEMLNIYGFMNIVNTHAEEEVETFKDSIIHDVIKWRHNIRKDAMSLVVVLRIR